MYTRYCYEESAVGSTHSFVRPSYIIIVRDIRAYLLLWLAIIIRSIQFSYSARPRHLVVSLVFYRCAFLKFIRKLLFNLFNFFFFFNRIFSKRFVRLSGWRLQMKIKSQYVILDFFLVPVNILYLYWIFYIHTIQCIIIRIRYCTKKMYKRTTKLSKHILHNIYLNKLQIN